MNVHVDYPNDPMRSLSERLLASVAIKIELPPSQYLLMAKRKQAIENHLQRDGSPLQDKIRIFYQQGSVAIGATIKAKFREDGFDIDIIVELMIDEITPSEALDLLYEAMRGDAGSRYYDCTERQTRCVTVRYADGMHIDLSPSVLIDGHDPRRSHIFHSKPEEPWWKDRFILTNSYAFAEEYNQSCPIDQAFADAYGKRARTADSSLQILMKDAESEPVPEHACSLGGKSAVTVALQLLKRNRILRWKHRKGRMPASVMLSSLALEVAAPGRSIGQNLQIISSHILDRLLGARRRGQLIVVENPRCRGDYFTDRWPENMSEQDLMIMDMQLFLRQLDIVRDEHRSFKDRTDVLKEMFGEVVAREVIEEFSDYTGGLVRSGNHSLGALGGVLAAPRSAFAKPAARTNTFFSSPTPISGRTGHVVLSLEEQVRAMERRWPRFSVSAGLAERSVIWFGDIKGLDRIFRISIEYGLPIKGEDSFQRVMPIVRVIRPSLVLNPMATEEPILPHVYFDKNVLQLSPLCLFDPRAGEWDHGMLIAKTTVPWAARWLACYEIWEATGRWVGGGCHENQEERSNAA